MLFFTGSSRESTSILKHQRKSTEERDGAVLQALHNIKQVAVEVQTCLEHGDLDEFARLLHYSWQEKRRLAPGLSTGFIDECYTLARSRVQPRARSPEQAAGDSCCSIVLKQAQDAVTEALESRGLKRMNFRFDQQGATVVTQCRQFSANLGSSHMLSQDYRSYTAEESQGTQLQTRQFIALLVKRESTWNRSTILYRA